MAYASSTPPALLTPGSFGGQMLKLWGYKSTDSLPTVCGSSYFSNGFALSMKVGDIVAAVQLSTAGAFSGYGLACVSAVTSGAGASVTLVATSS